MKRSSLIGRVFRSLCILFALLVAQLAPSTAAKWIVRWLSGSCEDTRTLASMALIKVGSPTVDPLVTAAQDGSVNRMQAIELLGQLAPPDQFEKIKSLDDGSGETQAAIDEAISFATQRANDMN